MTRPTLSVIIITHNESQNIADCLRSVSFADQIVVVDSNSSDGTQQIVQDMGATLIETTNWPGFGIQKNLALSKANCEWVLSIDADERVTKELQAEILSAICAEQSADAYYIPRLSSFLGYFIRHSGWYPDYVLRLFKRGIGVFSDDRVHEKVVLKGHSRHQRLQHHLVHYSYLTDSDYLRKLEHYSTAAAITAHAKNKTSSLRKSIGHALWAFCKSYLFKRGFLDGRAGLLVAISSAESTYHKYLKIMLLDEDKQRADQRKTSR